MFSNFDNEALIDEVKGDIYEFGKSYPVIAVYSYFGGDQDFVTDYVYDKPYPDEFADQSDYQEALASYRDSLKTLEHRKTAKITLEELLAILKEQAKAF